MTALLAASAMPTAQAAFTLLGPIPYSSMADSPFDLSGLGSTFFIEDFEDFDWTMPGFDMYAGGVAVGSSVDADDGVMNGLGLAGWSARTAFDTPTFASASLVFDQEGLGFLPTAVGIVITGTGDVAYNAIVVSDATGVPIVEFDLGALRSNPFDATDDVFVGLTNPYGMYSVSYVEDISPGGLVRAASLDHLQFGLLVPEPSSMRLVACAVWCTGRIAFLNRSRLDRGLHL